MFKCLIFDVDGTIIDTEAAILTSLQKVLASEGEVHKVDNLKFALGIPGKETLQRLQIADKDRVHAEWSNELLNTSEIVNVFEGLEDILHILSEKAIQMGIVTSKTNEELKGEFEPFGLNMLFQYIINSSDTEKHKPHPEPLLACLKGMDAQPNDAVYIGDSIYDMQCAQSAGVKFALALWGAKTVEGFEAADYILSKPQDILTLIDNE